MGTCLHSDRSGGRGTTAPACGHRSRNVVTPWVALGRPRVELRRSALCTDPLQRQSSPQPRRHAQSRGSPAQDPRPRPRGSRRDRSDPIRDDRGALWGRCLRQLRRGACARGQDRARGRARAGDGCTRGPAMRRSRSRSRRRGPGSHHARSQRARSHRDDPPAREARAGRRCHTTAAAPAQESA